MDYLKISATAFKPSRIELGTWAIGGRMWGGTDEETSIRTIHAAVEQGINFIDTAPAYGFGRSEEIIGKALRENGMRDRVILATKAGIEWSDNRAYRNGTKERIFAEIDDSLRRLSVETIDLYQVHWPDPLVAIEETAEAMRRLYEQGKIRAIGVCNFTVEEIERFRRVAPLHTCQTPFSLFEQKAGRPVLAYDFQEGITKRARTKRKRAHSLRRRRQCLSGHVGVGFKGCGSSPSDWIPAQPAGSHQSQQTPKPQKDPQPRCRP